MDSIPMFLEVDAEVRYWEDSTVNGVEDHDGSLIPFGDGKLWKPVIRLSDGVVLNWPDSVEADVHYKVCDQGLYWLLDEHQKRILKWNGDYVPDAFLCMDGSGFGDYIVMQIGRDGSIKNWKVPYVDMERWVPAET